MILAVCLCFSSEVRAQRQMEKLGRGLIAVRKTNTQVYVGWRLLGDDPATITFNLYRQLGSGSAVKINAAPISATTDYLDTLSAGNFNDTITYYVRPVIDSVEQEPGMPFTLPANAERKQYFSLPLRQDTGPDGPYTVKFCWVGDLDGDGEYDFVVDRHSTKNAAAGEDDDEGVSAYQQYLEAYKRDGTLLWRMCMGPNSTSSRGSSVISVGASDSVTVYDLDGDGRAEVIVRTANGVTVTNAVGEQTDATVAASDNTTQFISIIDGLTGQQRARAAIDTTWSRYGPLTFRLGIAYLDGTRPSVVFYGVNRDWAGDLHHYYLFTAWNYRDGQLTRLWQLEQDQRVLPGAESHSLRIADVDNDGRDEICEIGHVIDDNGTQLLRIADISHGDRFHIADIDPDNPGLETYVVQQNNSKLLAAALYEAGTGKFLKKWYMESLGDIGRGLSADITPASRGMEMFSTFNGIYSAKGELLHDTAVWPMEGLWWDGDLAREFIGGNGTYGINPIIVKFNPQTGNGDRVYVGGKNLYSYDGDYSTHNGTGGRPAFWGDILGDWREEIVLVASDCSALRIYTTTDSSTTRLYTLMHNPQYRAQATTKGYTQGSYVDYQLGYEMPQPAPPPMIPASLTWNGSVSAEWSAATAAQNWTRDAVTPGATPAPSIYADNESVLFDLSGTAQTTVSLTGNLVPKNVAVYSPANYTFAGAGKLSGATTLTKAGAGSLTIENAHDYTGATTVWDGALVVNGVLTNSSVVIWGGIWGGAAAAGKTGGRLEGTGTIGGQVTISELGTLSPGGVLATGTLTLNGGLATEGRAVLILDTGGTPSGANDKIVVNGTVTLSDLTTIIITTPDGSALAPGDYQLIAATGAVTGDASKIAIQTPGATPFTVSFASGALTLSVPTLRPPGAVTWLGGTNNDTWDLAGSANWTEGVFVPGDAVTFNDAGAAHATVTLEGSLEVASVTVSGTAGYTLTGAGAITGAGGLTKSGPGTLTIDTLNTYTGVTTVSGGALALSRIGDASLASPLGSSPAHSDNLVLDSGTLRIDAPADTNRGLTLGVNGGGIHVSNTNEILQISGTITGGGALRKTGPGTLMLATANDYAGGTVLEAGKLVLTSATANMDALGSGRVTLKAGTLSMSDIRAYNTVAAWPVEVPAGSHARLEADGRCTLTGALTGSGTLDYYSYYVRSDLEGDWSAFAGRINAVGGDFRVYNNHGMANAELNLAPGVYAHYARTVSSSTVTISIGALSGGSDSTLAGGPTSGRTLQWQIGARGTDTTFSGTITNGAGPTALSKIGAGVLTLSGTNTYTGPTTVSAGLLIIDGALGETAVTVKTEAALGGTGSLAGALTVENGARLQLPATPDSGLAVAGAITLSGTITIAPPAGFENTPGNRYRLFAANAALTNNATFVWAGDSSGRIDLSVNGEIAITFATTGTIARTALVTLAGLAQNSGATNGQAASARFKSPGALAAHANGNLYVADTGNNAIRAVDPLANVSTLAVTGAVLAQPAAIISGTGSTLVIADTGNNTLRTLNLANLQLDTLATGIAHPAGLARDATGNLYIASSSRHVIYKLAANTTTATVLAGVPDTTGTSAGFLNTPAALALDPDGQLYVADTLNNAIRKIDPVTGAMITVAGQPGVSGTTDGYANAARLNRPEGLVADTAGNLYIADTGNHTIRRLDTITGEVTTVAGKAGISGTTDGIGAAARLNTPAALSIDATTGDIYVADTGNHTIRVFLDGPRILKHPENLSITAGDTAAFNVLAIGAPNPDYQWQKNGAVIIGATSYAHTIANAQTPHAGKYSVIVSNEMGSVASGTATLTVTATATGTNSGTTTPPPGGGNSGGGGGGGAPGIYYITAIIFLMSIRYLKHIKIYKHAAPLLAALALPFAATGETRAQDALPPDAQLDLFLLVGQSNMAGRGSVEDTDKQPPARVWTLTKEKQWAPAVDPLHFDRSYAGVGPGRTFGILIAEARPNAQIGLIPCAVGGTSIGRWKKGGQLYNEAIARARVAMEHGRLKAILWHQGESDLPKAVAAEATYWDSLRKLIAAFRADLNAPDIPFIVGELGRFDHKDNKEHIAPFNEKLRAFAAQEKNCACVSSEGLGSLRDNLHFNADAARELGRRYAAAYLKMTEK